VYFYNGFAQHGVNKTHLDRHGVGGKNIGMPHDEQALIGDVERRLAKKYPALPKGHVAAVVREAYARLQSSSVRGFIPLLVERRADEELEGLSELRPDLEAAAVVDLAPDLAV
jgi:CRISPR/Cas system-associated exonuclease Cas4 (RecB family)